MLIWPSPLKSLNQCTGTFPESRQAYRVAPARQRELCKISIKSLVADQLEVSDTLANKVFFVFISPKQMAMPPLPVPLTPNPVPHVSLLPNHVVRPKARPEVLLTSHLPGTIAASLHKSLYLGHRGPCIRCKARHLAHVITTSRLCA